MSAKKSETSKIEAKANPQQSASKQKSSRKASPAVKSTAAKRSETSQRGKAAPRSPEGGAKRRGKAPVETVVPAGPETPLSEKRRRTPERKKSGSPSGPNAVTIVAKVDVGFGNAVFIRGDGGGLSWESGSPLECSDGGQWTWRGESGDPLEFKLLLNDRNWSAGENLVARPGEKVECAPRFE